MNEETLERLLQLANTWCSCLRLVSENIMWKPQCSFRVVLMVCFWVMDVQQFLQGTTSGGYKSKWLAYIIDVYSDSIPVLCAFIFSFFVFYRTRTQAYSTVWNKYWSHSFLKKREENRRGSNVYLTWLVVFLSQSATF